MAKKTFKLEQLFGSKTRARLLGLFMQYPQEGFFVRELTRKINAQLNSVRRELKNLMALGIIIDDVKANSIAKGNAKISKALSEKKKYYCVNPDFILYDDLRSLFKKVQILLKNNLVQEIDEKGKISYLAFTGHFVGQTDVPTDIIIVGSINQIVLQKLVAQFETEFAHEINYTLMPKDEFIYRRQVADRFLISVLEQEKIEMINRVDS
ncbi:MAG: hypothetical protein ABIH21_05870 [Patescibacteria group bacterium]